jgi:HPt (histidine-containing phosphotransfer) domain-containing protein
MSDIIDLKDGLERVQDDKDLLCELFDIFSEDFVGKFEALKVACAKGDLAAFQMLAHGLKGATGNISARRMHENCIELDKLGKASDVSGASAKVELLGRQFEEFKLEAARVKKEFGK